LYHASLLSMTVSRLEPDGVLIEVEAVAVLPLALGQDPNPGSGSINQFYAATARPGCA
jgi:hypothetical protein